MYLIILRVFPDSQSRLIQAMPLGVCNRFIETLRTCSKRIYFRNYFKGNFIELTNQTQVLQSTLITL